MNYLKRLLITIILIAGLCGSMLTTPAAAAAIPSETVRVSAKTTKK